LEEKGTGGREHFVSSIKSEGKAFGVKRKGERRKAQEKRLA